MLVVIYNITKKYVDIKNNNKITEKMKEKEIEIIEGYRK